MEFTNLKLDRRASVFIITLKNGEENRLNYTTCREIISALDYARKLLGTSSEGALIVQGNNAKFFTTVSLRPLNMCFPRHEVTR